MAQPVAPRSSILARLAVGALLVVVAVMVLQFVLGFVYSIIRALLFVALFAVVAWIVLVGRPDRRD
jgi:hypothetical protein